MKNKICYIMLWLLVSFSFVNYVFAEELTFTMTASSDNSEVVVGGETSISLNLKSDSVITSCQFKVNAASTLELVSKNGANNWNVDTENNDGSLVIKNSSSDTAIYTEGKKIFTFTYKVNGDGKVTFSDIKCTSSQSGEGTAEITATHQNIETSLTAKSVSEDTSLSSLKVLSGGQLSPEFNSNDYEYTINLDSANFSIEMTASNAEYQDKIVVTDAEGKTLDPKNLVFKNDGNQGLMLITITVNENTSKQYSLVVHYEQKELDNTLSSLKINGSNITLKDDVFDYTFKVGKNVTQVEVEAILKDSTNFKFREGNEPGIFQISGGTTSIALIIVPKSSQSGALGQTYNIEIIKEGTSAGNNTGNNNNNNNNNDNAGNTTVNPSTGSISKFIIIIILVSSLVGSVYLYKKNLESYK